ncbi:MAG: methionine adenosyltransferase [Ignisphaera sp.]|nr:methionine adenosyltransferase [Ignisphaera sp.]MDW8085004.1 methionine adenosyltransferase [Ignisphaera sp.]
MRNIVISEYRWQGIENINVEIVERKGVGHPDYIADGIAEAVSRELSKYYLKHHNLILHHNVDKVLVVGGQSKPIFGGGEVIHPIYIIVSGRATAYVRTSEGLDFIPIGTITLKAAREWIREHFRYLSPDEHTIIDYKIGQGSADLVALFKLGLKSVPLANDTSFGVGFAPLSNLENLVLKVERFLNSKDFKARMPAVGEDIKVMGLRVNNKIKLTVASAIVSRHVRDSSEYLSVKEEIKKAVLDLAVKIVPNYDVEVYVNVADKPSEGIYYLTVTGTSAEHGDDGATGRGNRVNGLITPMRLMSLEATAGKNPVSHVGKIYNVMANLIAEKSYREVKGIREIYVSILSQIGRPLNDPFVVDIKIVPEEKLTQDMHSEVYGIANEMFNSVSKITDMIICRNVTLF